MGSAAPPPNLCRQTIDVILTEFEHHRWEMSLISGNIWRAFPIPRAGARDLRKWAFGPSLYRGYRECRRQLGRRPVPEIVSCVPAETQTDSETSPERMQRRVNASLYHWDKRQHRMIKIKATAPAKTVDAIPERAEPAAPDETIEALSVTPKTSPTPERIFIDQPKKPQAPVPGSLEEGMGDTCMRTRRKFGPEPFIDLPGTPNHQSANPLITPVACTHAHPSFLTPTISPL